MRKQLAPGDLVFGIDSAVPFAGATIKSGLVLAVDYPRSGTHIGCEDRVYVFWMKAMKVKHECDCGLTLLSDFDRPLKSAHGVKIV